MNFVDIPAGADVFIDANVFVFHFVPDPVLGPACRDLLDRISGRDIAGFTSSDVLNGVAHRLMTYEAADKYGWPMQGIAYRLQQHPAELKALRDSGKRSKKCPASACRCSRSRCLMSLPQPL